MDVRAVKVSLAMLLAITLLSGCASRETVTSGIIGCPPSEVVVTEGDMGWTTNTWRASCRGKSFYCSNSDITGLVCSPELPKE